MSAYVPILEARTLFKGIMRTENTTPAKNAMPTWTYNKYNVRANWNKKLFD